MEWREGGSDGWMNGEGRREEDVLRFTVPEGQ